MKDVEEVSRLDVAPVQRIKSRSESRKPERPDSGKTTHAILIDAIAGSLFVNDIGISGVKNRSWYFFENKRRFNLMYKACPRNVQCLSMNHMSIPYDAATPEFGKERQWEILSFLPHSDEQRHKLRPFGIDPSRTTHLLDAALDNPQPPTCQDIE